MFSITCIRLKLWVPVPSCSSGLAGVCLDASYRRRLELVEKINWWEVLSERLPRSQAAPIVDVELIIARLRDMPSAHGVSGKKPVLNCWQHPLAGGAIGFEAALIPRRRVSLPIFLPRLPFAK